MAEPSKTEKRRKDSEFDVEEISDADAETVSGGGCAACGGGCSSCPFCERNEVQ